MHKRIEVIGNAMLVLALVDVVGFAAWIYSGQHPVDSFYVGTITSHALALIIQ